MRTTQINVKTVGCQAPLSLEFSRQECWNGLPFPSPGDLPNPGIKPRSPALQVYSLPSEPPGKPMDCSIPGFSVLHYLSEFAQIMSIESVILSNHLILCHPLLLLLSVFPSIRVFSMSRLVPSGGQSIGVSASAVVLPVNI